MRFDIPIMFVAETPGEYNTSTGDYGDSTKTIEARLANVTDANEQTMRLVYGRIHQGALVIRIQGDEPGAFDYIQIGERHYRVDTYRKLRRLCTFVVSEVQT